MIETILHEYIQSNRGRTINLSIPIHQDGPSENRKFRMSDAGRCHLYRYWKRQGKEIPMPMPDALLTMEAGNVMHAWIAAACESAGYLIETEGELEDQHRIGHFDLLLDMSGDLVLADVKTISSKKMFTMKKYRNPPDWHHIAQLMTYWDSLTDESPILNEDEKIDKTLICYVNRDNWNEFLEIDIERTPLLLAAVQDDWEDLTAAWESGKYPKANPTNEWECKYCPFKAICEWREVI